MKRSGVEKYRGRLGVELFIFLLFLIGGCGNQGKSQNSGQTNAQQLTSETDYLKLVSIKTNEKVILDSPQKFIEIAILYYHNQKSWLEEIRIMKKNADSNTVINEEEILKEKRNKFYESLFITENDFASYYSAHYKDVNEFLDKNPAYKEAYEKVGM